MWRENEGIEEDVAEENVVLGRASVCSEMSVVEERVRAAPAACDMPAVSNLNITKSSRVHIGPKFVSVTQNVSSTEAIKGRFLGLELVSAKRKRRLRCSVAIFVCWAFVVACGLAFYLFQNALATQQARLDIGLQEPWYLRRDDWQAMPAYRIELHKLPLKYVLIGHTAAGYCDQKYSCIKRVLDVQQDHLRRDFDDIGPNYLVGGNGFVFEGRGANVIGAMVKSWNTKSISIMFLGDYTSARTDQAQLEHVARLLDVLVRESVLRPDYVLYGHCQVATRIISPGPNIMNKLDSFPHWQPDNASLCLPG